MSDKSKRSKWWRKKLAVPNLDKCLLCGRVPIRITKHHLEPRESSDEPKLGRWVKMCRTCHFGIHAIFTNEKLREELNTPEKMIAHPYIAKLGAWVAKMEHFTSFTKKEIARSIGPMEENPISTIPQA